MEVSMTHWKARLTAILMLLSLATYAHGDSDFKKAAILVPGTFNSIAPGAIYEDNVRQIWEASPYFSKTIIDRFRSHGYAVKVISDLAPLGSFEINGEA